MLHSVTSSTSHTVTPATQNYRRTYPLVLTHPEDIYPFVKLSSAHGLSHPLPKCRVNLIVFDQMKSLRSFVSRLNLSSPDILIWHEMDYWGEQRTAHPISEMKDRMSVLVALASQKPVTILTTCLALLEKTISSEQLSQGKILIHPGDQLNHTFQEKLKQNGYISSSHGDVYGTFASKPYHLEISPPGTFDSIRLELSSTHHIIQIEPVCSSAFTRSHKNNPLSSYAIYPPSETLLDDRARPMSAQALYASLLEQKTEASQRNLIMEQFHHRIPFAGYYKMSPLLRKGAQQQDQTLLDHLILEAKDDFFIWDFMTQEQRDLTIEESLKSAIESYQQELESGHPTLHPKDYYFHPKKIQKGLKHNGFCGYLFSHQNLPAAEGPPLVVRDYLQSPLFSRGGKRLPSKISPTSQKHSPHHVLSTFLREVFFTSDQKQSLTDLSDVSLTQFNQDTKIVVVCENERMYEQWLDLFEDHQQEIEQLDHPWECKRLFSSKAQVFLVLGSLKQDYRLNYENVHYIPASWLLSPLLGPSLPSLKKR